jgi:hypothetical protein
MLACLFYVGKWIQYSNLEVLTLTPDEVIHIAAVGLS